MKFLGFFCVAALLATPKIGFGLSSESKDPISESWAVCLADAAWVEARGEGNEGKLAVIEAVLNRVNHSEFPSDPCSVISEEGQFQWFGTVEPDRETPEWERSLFLAHGALSERSPQSVASGAQFFCAPKKDGCVWHSHSPRLCKVKKIGGHDFFTICESG